ncbi:MAG: AraC family transcriptional regulator [Burkholderiales bacterium]|nr:MAG: AraC family transcriptional regulator [Burkholderiales bacterium]
MSFLSIIPPAPLNVLVETIWDWTAAPQPHRLERIVPVANAGLILNLSEDQTRVYDDEQHCLYFSGATLDGPRTRSHLIDTDEQVAVMGVVFRPGGAATFFRERMDRLANGSVDLDALMGRRACALRERLLDTDDARGRLALLQQELSRWLGTRAMPASARPLAHALQALDADPRVAALASVARELGSSPRQLGELFRQQVGMTPKRYLRLRRFHQVVNHVGNGAGDRNRIDWAGIALDCGYHDQAHLAHEFREFSGVTPTAFLRATNYHPHIVPA